MVSWRKSSTLAMSPVVIGTRCRSSSKNSTPNATSNTSHAICRQIRSDGGDWQHRVYQKKVSLAGGRWSTSGKCCLNKFRTYDFRRVKALSLLYSLTFSASCCNHSRHSFEGRGSNRRAGGQACNKMRPAPKTNCEGSSEP